MIIERHVFLIYNQPTNTLLSVSRRELIAQFRPSGLTHKDLDQRAVGFPTGEQNFVDIACHRAFIREGRRPIVHSCFGASEGVLIGIGWRLLVHHDIAAEDATPRKPYAVQVNRIIAPVS